MSLRGRQVVELRKIKLLTRPRRLLPLSPSSYAVSLLDLGLSISIRSYTHPSAKVSLFAAFSKHLLPTWA